MREPNSIDAIVQLSIDITESGKVEVKIQLIDQLRFQKSDVVNDSKLIKPQVGGIMVFPRISFVS